MSDRPLITDHDMLVLMKDWAPICQWTDTCDQHTVAMRWWVGYYLPVCTLHSTSQEGTP